MRACRPSAAVGVGATLPSLLVALLVEQTEANYLVVFFGCSFATGSAWLVALKVCNHPFWTEVLLLVARLRKGNREA